MMFKSLKNTVVFSAVTAVIFGVFVSCENPFVKDLGEKVDVEWPTITVLSPPVGSIINKEVTFTGRAGAYREVDRVEVRILNPDKYSAAGPLMGWTRVSNISGGDKSRSWSYPLDTAGPIFKGQEDGFLNIQFRAWDVNNLVVKDGNLNTYVYIIKNKPSQIKMSAPTDENLGNGSAERETKTDIRGQVIDRRGIKPGFPRIKIWPAGSPEPAGGWVTLFLSGNGDDVIDTMDDTNNDWHYGDRSQMQVINQANFVYKLAVIDRIDDEEDVGGNQILKAVYKTPFEGLTPGPYNFRIWTSDTYFYTDEDIQRGLATASMKKWPREPNPSAAAPETVLVGFNPEIPGYQPGVDDSTAYEASGNYWALEVKSAGQDPDIALDNSDLGPTPATVNAVLSETPNIYISESTSKKILTGNASRIAFRLRLRATHPDGIASVSLRWDQPGSGSSGDALTWTSSTPLPSSEGNGSVYLYNAPESAFPSSPRAYQLSVTAIPTGSADRSTTKTYTVTVSSSKPTVKIESVTGAATEPTPSNDYYTVNGNIEVFTSSAAAMGMNTEGGFDLVKWIVEPATSTTTLDAINTYNTTPSANNLVFFNNIPNVTAAGSTATGGRVTGTTGAFRFNTAAVTDLTDYWLYVIAQDSVQNLGYTRVKLRVDQSTDKPTLETPGMVSTTDTNPITGANDLFIEIDNDKKQVGAKVRRNVLDKDTGIDLTFKDDDGISLTNGITITLTDLNINKTVTIGAAQIQSILSGSGREWSGILSQRIMAAAMANNGSNMYLRDGIYKLDIAYSDNAGDKVTITGTTAASVAGTPKTFYFCVMSNQPTITISSPEKNTFVNMGGTEIKGTITSYIPVQKIWLSFDPKLSGTADSMLPLYRDAAYATPGGWTGDTPNATTGLYTYYWHITGVYFAATTPPTSSEDRRFTLEAADNLGGFTELPWSVKVDNVPPTVALEQFFFDRPLEANQTLHRINGKFNFIISANDNNGIQVTGTNAHVKWWIKRSGDSAPAWEETVTANGTSGQFTTAVQSGARFTHIINSGTTAGSYSRLPDGTYKLYAAAEDRAGNKSVPVQLQEFSIDQAADYPAVTDAVPNGVGLTDVRNKTDLKITGKASDDDGFTGFTAGTTVQIRFRTSNANTAWETAWRNITTASIDPTGALTFEYVIPSELKTGTAYFAADGFKEYQIRVTDVSANKNPTAAGVTIENAATIGVAQKIWPTDTTGYSFLLKDTMPEIFFLQYDENSKHTAQYSEDRPVFKDRASVLTSLLGGWVKDNYLESVTVSFDRGDEVALLIYDRENGVWSEPGGTGYYNTGSTQFDWNLQKPGLPDWLPTNFDTTLSPPAGVLDGLHTVIITARDVAGNTVSQEWKFYRDTVGPDITLTNITTMQSPLAARALSVISGDAASAAITGSFNDLYSPILSATYQFDVSGPSGPVTIPDTAAKTKTWSIPIPTNESPLFFADGKHYVSITALDKLGNSKTMSNLYFVVDRANPAVSDPADMIVGSVTGDSSFPKALPQENERVFSAAGLSSGSAGVAFTLSGTAKDENLNDIIIALRVGSTSSAAVVNIALKDSTHPDGLDEWTAGGTFNSTDTGADAPRLTVTPGVTANEWNWTLKILNRDLYALNHSVGYSRGVSCYVSVNARDLAQRDSGAQHWRFFLDTEAPVITFSNFQTSGNTVFDGESVTMTGNVSDDNRVKSIRYYLKKYNYATEDWEYCSTSGVGVWTATVPSPLPWSTYALSNPGSLESWTLTGAGLDSSIYGTNILAGTKGEGRYELCIEAADWSLGSSAGNVLTSSKEFYVDRYDPSIVWTDLARTYYRTKSNGSIELKFTASDSNYLWNTGDTGYPANSFAVSIKKPDNSTYTVPAGEVDLSGIRTFNSVTGVYTQTIILSPKVAGSATPWPSGKYTLTLTVTDRAGKQASVDHIREFTVDNTAPTIEINGNGGASPVNLNEAITGRNQLRGRFTKTNYSPVAFAAFYVAPDGVTPPSNLTNLNSSDFDIDLANSTDLDTLIAAGWRFNIGDNSDKSILKNGSGATLMRIEQGFNNVNMVIPDTRNLLAGYAAANTTAASDVTFEGASITGETVNKLALYFLAIDEAGNRSVKIYNYWIYPEGDRPTVTISSPNELEPEDRRLLNGRIRIGGSAKDNVRVKRVWFRILGKGGSMTTPFTEADRVEIPVWTDTWEEAPGSAKQESKTLTLIGGVNQGPGWFMANGGGKLDVSWYAFINTNGELDPDTTNSRKITIEVLAEDDIIDDATGEWSGTLNSDPAVNPGLPSKSPNKTVSASVVKGAPEFNGELVKSGASGVSSAFGNMDVGVGGFTEANGWYSLQTIYLRKRASYSVIVTHETGIKEITWIPPTNSGINGGNPIDLLNDSDSYYNKISTGYAADLAAVNAGTSGAGIAVKAGPRSVKTGSGQSLAANTKYLIWKWDGASPPAGLTGAIPGYSSFPTGTDWSLVTFTTTGAVTGLDLGNIQLMEANAEGKFEWVVVADIHADLIEGGRYKYVSGGTGTYSGMSPLNLRATENSQSVALYMNHTAQLPIDNQPPRGAYTHNPYVAGQAATFGGAAGDSGPVNGVARVVLWFSRNSGGTETPISWNEQTTTGVATGNTFNGGGTVPDGVNSAWLGTGPTSPNMPNLAAYASSSTEDNWSFIVIERNDPNGSNLVYGHKRPIGFATVGGDLGTSWYVTLDSTLIVSGRITAHYIVYDKAGNASYYTNKLVVMNGVPRITRITLATDIRGDTNLTGGAYFAANKTYGDGRTGSPVDSVTTSPIETIGNATAPGGTNAQRGVSEFIPIDTANKVKVEGGYGAVYDEPFNVRNNLLAVQVEVDQELGAGGKDRKFRVEYVSGARRFVDTSAGAAGAATATTNGNAFYKNIRAGRIYIIEESGSRTNRFPWGSFGAQGENPPKGSAFMAVENGADLDIPVADYRNGTTAAGLPSVWELNSTYYSGDTLTRGNVPSALQLSDVAYPTSGSPSQGKSAEFVYGGGAFEAQQFDANGTAVTKIRDFTPTIPAGDGRPADYPALTANAYPWAAHSLFIVRVFGGNEEDLFGDFALLSIRVNNDDRTRPYAQLYDLNPKTEDSAQAQALSIPGVGRNRARGGLYNTGTASKMAKSGHIEPRKTTNLTSEEMGGAANQTSATITQPFISPTQKNARLFAVDTVSGDVILRGYVEDDQRIAEVTLNFGGTAGADGTPTGGTNVTILQRRTSGFGLEVPAAVSGRVAVTETIELNRHRVEWAYLWSTEVIPNTVVGNTTVYAIARNADSSLTAKTRSFPVNLAEASAVYNNFNPDYEAAMPRYNRIPVNVRPYITGFRRNLAAHNTRSRQGWYMFAKGEQIVVAGFNLAVSAATGPNVTIGGQAHNNLGDATALAASHAIEGDNNFSNVNRFRALTVSNADAVSTGNGVITLVLNNYAAVNTRPGTRPSNEGANPDTLRPEMSANRPYILPWNIEYSPGTDGSELWDDFTQAHIWQSNDTTGDNGGRFASRDNALIFNPAMSIDPTNGTLYESHNANGGTDNAADWYNTGRTIRSAITTTTVPNPVTQFSDPIFFSDVYRSPGRGASTADTWAVSSIIGRSGTNEYWLALGGIYISGPGGGAMEFHGGGIGSSGTNPSYQSSAYSSSLYYGESTWYNASANSTGRTANPPATDQFMNPHIVTSYNGDGSQEHIHVSYYDYYDAQGGSIKYRYNRRGNGIAMTGTTASGNGVDAAATTRYNAIPKMWVNLDGGLDQEDTDATTHIVGGAAIAANSRVVRFNSTIADTKTARETTNAGRHNSIAVTSEGYPVIAYYDEVQQRLKLAVSRSLTPVQNTDWVIRDYVIEDDLRGFGTGEYVSMKIDTTNNKVHIAAMNTNKRLVYVTGNLHPPSSGNVIQTTGGVLTDVEVQVVDSVGSVGRWCSLSLDANGNPWISYMDESYIGARDGVKVAYLNKTTFYKGSSGYFPGEYVDFYEASLEGWEIMHVPTTYRVENPTKSGREHGRLGMECFPARNVTPTTNNRRWSAAVGYLSTDLGSDRYRVAYYVK